MESYSADKTVIWNVLPVRIPIVMKGQHEKLLGFKYMQRVYLQFTNKKNWERVKARFKEELVAQLKGNHDVYECFDPNYVFIHLPVEKRKKVAFQNPNSIFLIKYDKSTGDPIFHPKPFQIQVLDPNFAQNYTKDSEGRWVFEREFEFIEDKFKGLSNSLLDKVTEE